MNKECRQCGHTFYRQPMQGGSKGGGGKWKKGFICSDCVARNIGKRASKEIASRDAYRENNPEQDHMSVQDVQDLLP